MTALPGFARERATSRHLWGLAALLLATLAVSLFSGLPDDPALREVILYSVRLPRLLVACLSGAVLAGSGAALQSLLRNPLAEPALLGVSAGAAFAAVAALALAASLGIAASALVAVLPVAAFLGGMLVVMLVFVVSARNGRVDVSEVLLAGMAMNLLAGAGVGVLTYLAPEAELRGMVFWALGSLSGLNWREVIPAALGMLIALGLLLPMRRQLNLLAMGEVEAERLGIAVDRLKGGLVFACALGVGASVAVAGIIGFVGLLVPHLLRRLTGPDYHLLMPAAMLGGALLLCAADLLSRWVIYPAELPVGLLTTLLGGPMFLWLVARGAARGWRG